MGFDIQWWAKILYKWVYFFNHGHAHVTTCKGWTQVWSGSKLKAWWVSPAIASLPPLITRQINLCTELLDRSISTHSHKFSSAPNAINFHAHGLSFQWAIGYCSLDQAHLLIAWVLLILLIIFIFSWGAHWSIRSGLLNWCGLNLTLIQTLVTDEIFTFLHYICTYL